jgi:hypothetical protein
LAGVTVTIPPQVVELRTNPVELPACDPDTLNVGEPAPAAKNDRLAGKTLTAGVAVGAVVGGVVGVVVGLVVGVVVGATVGLVVGVVVGVVVGAVVGLIVGEAVAGVRALTDGDGLDDPPPPHATRETATMPARTMNERNFWPHTRRKHTTVCPTSQPYHVVCQAPPT